MHQDLLNILSESNKDIDNQKLMDYISGRLTAEQKHEVEKWMIDHPFFNEAVEGLQQAGPEKQVMANVEQINNQLRKYLQQKKKKRDRNARMINPWSYIAVLLVIAIIVLVYLIILKLG